MSVRLSPVLRRAAAPRPIDGGWRRLEPAKTLPMEVLVRENLRVTRERPPGASPPPELGQVFPRSRATLRWSNSCLAELSNAPRRPLEHLPATVSPPRLAQPKCLRAQVAQPCP